MAEDGRSQLATYLNDHLAGSTAGIELVRRAAGEHAGTPLGDLLAELGAQIEEDRDALAAFMAANGVDRQRLKLAAAWAAEKVGRLKLDGALLRRSSLTPFAQLETLAIGMHGKELLWRALRPEPGDDATAARLDELIARAQRQREAVERYRVEAAARALSAVRGP